MGTANVSLLCGRESVFPHTAEGTCPRLCLRAKDQLRTPGGGLPEPLRPTESPGRWRPPRSGDQDRTEFLDHGSSPEQQSDNLGAHFLSGAEKCCVSMLPANCRVSQFRFRPARRGVSRRQNLLCRANGLRLGPWSSQKVAVDAEINEVLDVLVVRQTQLLLVGSSGARVTTLKL